MRQSWLGIIILAMGTSCTTGHSYPSGPKAAVDVATTRAALNDVPVSNDAPVAPGKFIPTFAILYGGPKNQQALKDAARFDLIDAGSSAVSDVRTWQALKQLNPHIKIFIYELGPGEFTSKFNTAPGWNWDWITTNHGLTS